MKNLKISKKTFLYFGITIVAIVIAAFVVLWLINRPYRSKIPTLPDFQTLSMVVQEQITAADKSARRSPSSENLGMLGMVYQSCGMNTQAIECYKLAIQKNEKEWIWNYYLGSIYREMDDPSQVITSFSAVVKSNPQIWHGWFYLGEGFAKKGVIDQAEFAFRQIPYFPTTESSNLRADLFPLNTYSQYELAKIKFKGNNPDETEKMLQQMISSNNAFGPSYRLLADVYRTRGDSSWSRYYVLRANDLAGYKSPVDTILDRITQLSRSEQYIVKKMEDVNLNLNPQWAINLLNNALANVPDSKLILSKAVKTFLMINPEEAMPLLPKHITTFANDKAELGEVAPLLVSTNQYAKAGEYYSQLVKLQPENAEYVAGKALTLTGEGRKAEAVKMIRELAASQKPEALKPAIYFLIVERENELAKEYLQQLKKVAPSDAKISKYEGMLAHVEGKAPQAISALKTAYRNDPSDISTVQYLGNLFMQQQMWKDALDHFRGALIVHPNNPYLLERIGTLFINCPDNRIRNYSAAREFSQRAFINVNSSAETMISAGRSMAMAYASLGDKEKSAEYFNIVLNMVRQANYPQEYVTELEEMIEKVSQK